MMRWVLVASLIISLLVLSVAGQEPSAGVAVTCGDYVITVSIEKALYPSLEANRLRLYYSSFGGCQATQTSTHLYVSTSLHGCGTLFLETGDSLVFSNIVVQDSVPSGSGDDGSTAVITRDHDFDLPFECKYSRKRILTLQFVPEGRVEIPGVEGFGDLTFTFDVYKTSSYSTPYANGEFPVQVTLNDYLYFEYGVESSADLVVFATTCKATPGPSFYSSPHYLIIQNGCPMDTTLEYDYDDSRNYQRFKFRGFRFFNTYESYYIHCELLACHSNSLNSRCTQGCLSGSSRRKRREVQEEITTSDSYLIKRGPLLIKEKPKESTDTGKQSAAVIGGAAAAGGLALVAIIALAVLFVKYRIARLLLNRNKIGDLYATQEEQMSRSNAYIQENDMMEHTDKM